MRQCYTHAEAITLTTFGAFMHALLHIQKPALSMRVHVISPFIRISLLTTVITCLQFASHSLLSEIRLHSLNQLARTTEHRYDLEISESKVLPKRCADYERIKIGNIYSNSETRVRSLSQLILVLLYCCGQTLPSKALLRCHLPVAEHAIIGITRCILHSLHLHLSIYASWHLPSGMMFRLARVLTPL